MAAGPGPRDEYDPETLTVGMLGRPHGVHGEINLRPHDFNGRALEGARRLLLVVDGHTKSYDVTDPADLSRRLEGVAVITIWVGRSNATDSPV